MEPPCARLQFFDEGRTAMNDGTAVCADPTVASNIGAQCCSAIDDEAVCPEEVGSDGHVTVFEYEQHTGDANHGDYCRASSAGKCPVGCKATNPGGAPHCVTEADGTNSLPCHLDLGGTVSAGGGECLYVAEPMTFAAADRRCAAEYPDSRMCNRRLVRLGASTIDGLSPDWQATCGGFMLSWTNSPCTSVAPQQYQQQPFE
jgi:hypothetical protein